MTAPTVVDGEVVGSEVALLPPDVQTKVDLDQLSDKLKRAGLLALKQRAASLKDGTGAPEAQCYACAAIEIYNRGRGENLEPWWKFQAAAS